MGRALHDIGGSNVDDVAANGAGGVEGQGLVLLDGEHVQLALVNGSLINRIGHRSVDEFAGGKYSGNTLKADSH